MSKDSPDRLAIDGSGYRVGIVAARYNFHLVNALLESVVETLKTCGVKEEDMEIFRVPGSNEVPQAVAFASQTDDFDVLIALGVVIAGETDHHDVINHSTAQALQSIGINQGHPVINGILTVNSVEQAEARINGDLNRGAEFAHAALEMARLFGELEDRIMDEELMASLEEMEWLDDEDDESDFDDWKK